MKNIRIHTLILAAALAGAAAIAASCNKKESPEIEKRPETPVIPGGEEGYYRRTNKDELATLLFSEPDLPHILSEGDTLRLSEKAVRFIMLPWTPTGTAVSDPETILVEIPSENAPLVTVRARQGFRGLANLVIYDDWGNINTFLLSTEEGLDAPFVRTKRYIKSEPVDTASIPRRLLAAVDCENELTYIGTDVEKDVHARILPESGQLAATLSADSSFEGERHLLAVDSERKFYPVVLRFDPDATDSHLALGSSKDNPFTRRIAKPVSTALSGEAPQTSLAPDAAVKDSGKNNLILLGLALVMLVLMAATLVRAYSRIQGTDKKLNLARRRIRDLETELKSVTVSAVESPSGSGNIKIVIKNDEEDYQDDIPPFVNDEPLTFQTFPLLDWSQERMHEQGKWPFHEKHYWIDFKTIDENIKVRGCKEVSANTKNILLDLLNTDTGSPEGIRKRNDLFERFLQTLGVPLDKPVGEKFSNFAHYLSFDGHDFLCVEANNLESEINGECEEVFNRIETTFKEAAQAFDERFPYEPHEKTIGPPSEELFNE